MIQLNEIVKKYLAGDSIVEALKGVSINFRNNEFVSILGPSGCGKTTLLNIVGGLDKYSSGDIIIDGVSTKDYKDKDWDTYRNHYIGFVFQSYNLISHLNVLENVELALSIAGCSQKEKRAKAIKALERVGLKSQIKKKPNQLSGGQMQRVAIARAIVNNPKIILADEPTGALDSKTSVQVMDILKEISKNCLVIMVTHNENLAKEYSDRIIRILDGKMIDDSKPYSPSKVESVQKNEVEAKNDKKTKKPRSAMGVFTAISLSLKNLLSKKWKTIITSFAGSIGIIGIALVLSVSNGLNSYVGNMQSEALSGYPVTVGTVAIDYDALTEYFSSNEGNNQEVDKNTQTSVYSVSNLLFQFGNFNFLSSDFVEYINDYVKMDNNKPESQRYLTSYKMSYPVTLQILTKSMGRVKQINTKSITSSTSGKTSTSTFFEGISNKNYILENYEVLGGENAHYPANKNEVALVIGSDNSIAYESLVSLGLSDGIEVKATEKTTLVDLEKFVGKEYRFLKNNDYFIKTTDGENISFSRLAINEEDNVANTTLYNGLSENTLKISCILRLKNDSSSSILSQGIMYLPELSEYLRADAEESEVVKATRLLGVDDQLYIPFNLEISELSAFIPAGAPQEYFKYDSCRKIIDIVKSKFNTNLTEDDAKQLALQMLGAGNVPNSVMFYTSSFDGKKDVMDYINAWNNKDTERNNKIVVNDATGFLTETLGSLINIVSYVLIAFSGISLVVSSIMIGVITYTSVIERTKEIGVLRSIGARKKDIARVFNAETFTIGLTSGVFGVLVSFILTFPISSLIKKLAGGTIKTSLAYLTLPNALIMILISVVLTLIAGLSPALMAAKKDPVKALRTE